MISPTSTEPRTPVDILEGLRRNIERVFFGKPETATHLLIGLLSRGHVLIEDVPGVGKTVLARAIARSIDCSSPGSN